MGRFSKMIYSGRVDTDLRLKGCESPNLSPSPGLVATLSPLGGEREFAPVNHALRSDCLSYGINCSRFADFGKEESSFGNIILLIVHNNNLN
jgi:hypothetical protein